MKKFSILLSCFLLLFCYSNIYADNNTIRNQINTKLQEKLQAREEKLQTLMERVQTRNQERVASKEAKLTQLKKNIVLKYYQNMSKRMWAVIGRLDTLILRIDQRVEIIDSQTDKDLTDVNSSITKAKALLSDTRAILTSSDSTINSVIDSNDPKEAFLILKQNITDIKNNLKEVHSLLVHVIGDLEGLRVGTLKITPTTAI